MILIILNLMYMLSAAFGELVWEQRTGYGGDGRHHPITFANETHGFLLTGSTQFSTPTKDFYMYIEATDEWTDLSSSSSKFPGKARSFGYAVVLNSLHNTKAYLGFGADIDGQRLKDWWEFDMSTHIWKELAELPGSGRRHPAVIPVLTSTGWHIHVGLGDGRINDVGPFSNFDDWWSYDIDSDVWTRLPNFISSKRHHPFYFGIGKTSYVGFGHSDSLVERDFYSYDEEVGWKREADFESYDAFTSIDDEGRATVEYSDQPITNEARVAGTQFSIELPLLKDGSNTDAEDGASLLSGSIGFILSGDGDDHSSMSKGEFHCFYPKSNNVIAGPDNISKWWRQLTPHPGASRWAPGSFVMRGSARVYFTGGYDRIERTLFNDLWLIDLSSLFTSTVDENVNQRCDNVKCQYKTDCSCEGYSCDWRKGVCSQYIKEGLRSRTKGLCRNNVGGIRRCGTEPRI